MHDESVHVGCKPLPCGGMTSRNASSVAVSHSGASQRHSESNKSILSLVVLGAGDAADRVGDDL